MELMGRKEFCPSGAKMHWTLPARAKCVYDPQAGSETIKERTRVLTVATTTKYTGAEEGGALLLHLGLLLGSHCLSQVIMLTFGKFDVEPDTYCRYDSVSVFNGAVSDDAKRLGKFCGDKAPR